MTPVLIKCTNCFGTGTVYRRMTFGAKPTLCPVCKGKTKIPEPVKETK